MTETPIALNQADTEIAALTKILTDHYHRLTHVGGRVDGYETVHRDVTPAELGIKLRPVRKTTKTIVLTEWVDDRV